MSCCCGTLKPVGTPTPVILAPVTIMSGNVVAGWDAADISGTPVPDIGVPVALWPDASGNGFDLSGAGAAQPLWSADGGPNGQPSVLFDGIDDFLTNAALNLPAPGTTPTFFWVVMRQIAWTLDDVIIESSGGLSFYQSAVSPEVRQFNGAEVNASNGMPLDTYKRIEVYFSNSVADYIKAGSVTVTGANAGNIDANPGIWMGSSFTEASGFANIEVCECWIFNALPNASQIAQLNAYAALRYGATVLT